MTIQAFRLGSVGQDSLTGVKYAVAYIAAGDNYKTLESPVGTDYQVTAGYTLYITKIVWGSSTAGSQIKQFGYGDDGIAEGAAAPTNAVVLIPFFLQGSTTALAELEGIWTIPSGKYPYFQANTALSGFIIFGVEIAN